MTGASGGGGGGVWESNPPVPTSSRRTGFEDQESHQTLFASTRQYSIAAPPPHTTWRIMMNHEWTRMNTNRPEDRWNSFNHKRHPIASAILQFRALGVTMSWDEGLLGARASRPHQAWHSLYHLPHLDRPGTAPWLSFGLADAVPADRVAACSIALTRISHQGVALFSRVQLGAGFSASGRARDRRA